MNVVTKKKKRLTGTSLELVRSGLHECRNAPFPAQKMRNDIEQLTTKQIAAKYGVKLASKSYNYKPTIVNYLDACIAETNQANAAAAPPVAPPVAPQNNVNLVDVDNDATLPVAPGSAAAAVLPGNVPAGPAKVAVTPVPVRHRPGAGGQAYENPTSDAVTASELCNVIKTQQAGFNESMKQQNEANLRQFMQVAGLIKAVDEKAEYAKEKAEYAEEVAIECKSNLRKTDGRVGNIEGGLEALQIDFKEKKETDAEQIAELRSDIKWLKAMTPKKSVRFSDSKAPKSILKWNDCSSDEEDVSTHSDYDEDSGDGSQSIDI